MPPSAWFRPVRFGLVLVGAAIVVAACGGDGESSQLRPEVAEAITWCDDPLFDGDEDGVALCEAVAEARSAGRIECVDTRFQPDEPGWCDGLGTDLSWLQPLDGPAPEVGRAEEPPPAPAPPATDADVGPIDSTTGYPAKLVVFERITFGGCARLDRCGHWTVFGDGRVIATNSAGEELAYGEVEPGLVQDLVGESDTDTTRLQQALEPGNCEAAVDGDSDLLIIHPAGFEIDTCEFSLNSDAALVRVAAAMSRAVAAAAPIDWDAVGG